MNAPRAHRALALIAGVSALGTLTCACGAGAVIDEGRKIRRGLAMPTAPPTAMILRASFDDDPSTYMGRMVPNEVEPHQLDENLATPSLCKKYISHKTMRSSMSKDENLIATSSVGASLGYESIAKISAGYKGSVTLRAKYKTTQKMMAYIKDEDAPKMFKCCLKAPDQCTKRMLGTYVRGTGRIYQAVGSAAEFKAGGSATKIVADGDVELKGKYAWKQLTEFEDVYFAFRPIGGIPAPPPIPPCSSWQLEKPVSPLGEYFVGISQKAVSEQQAVRNAMFDARRQVVSFLSTFVSTSVSQSAKLMEGVLKDTDVAKAAAQGVASRVIDLTRCPMETEATPKGTLYKARVLTFFPNSEKKAAAQDAIAGIAEALEKKGKGADAAKIKGMAADLQ